MTLAKLVQDSGIFIAHSSSIQLFSPLNMQIVRWESTKKQVSDPRSENLA